MHAESFMDGKQIHLTIDEARGGLSAGTHVIPVPNWESDTFAMSATG